MSQKTLSCIQKLYKSDIRSMINFMQSNQDITNEEKELNIIDNNVWENLFSMLSKREKIENIKDFVRSISIHYNIDKKNIIKDFLNYIIRNHEQYLKSGFLNYVENLMHSQIQNNNVHIYYSLSRLTTFLSETREL